MLPRKHEVLVWTGLPENEGLYAVLHDQLPLFNGGEVITCYLYELSKSSVLAGLTSGLCIMKN